MAPLKKIGYGKTSGTLKKSKAKSPPKTPPRSRVMCPGCSTELTLHKMLSNSDAFIYASTSDMKQLGIECNNDSCPLNTDGIEDAEVKPINPVIKKCVDTAKKDHAAIKAAKKEEKKKNKKRKRDEKKTEYSKYDPFSGIKEKEAGEAIRREERQKEEAKKIFKGWGKIQKAAEELEELEELANLTGSIEE